MYLFIVCKKSNFSNVNEINKEEISVLHVQQNFPHMLSCNECLCLYEKLKCTLNKCSTPIPIGVVIRE